MRTAIIGLGSMGMGAAISLVRAGHQVTGCDLREAARAELIAAGGDAVASPAELPTDLEALIVFVVNAAQVDQVLFGQEGAAPNLPEGAVVLCCTTTSPEYARTLATKLEALNLHLLDAPVSGGASAARAGTMTVMASGSPDAFATAGPALDAIAGKIWRLGDEPGIGSTVKMVNQLLAGVHIATAAEAMALGIRAGADPQTLFDVISTSAGNSWMFQNRVPPPHPRRRRHPALRRQHLRQGSRHRPRPGSRADLPPAPCLRRAPALPRRRRRRPRRAGRQFRHPLLGAFGRHRIA